MLTEVEAIDRACTFFAMSGGEYITGPATPGVEYRPGLFRLLPKVHLEGVGYWVFFELLPPFADEIDPSISVVEVDVVTGACKFVPVM
jgi:hypothetical protein